jgi:hypothetical protein
MEEPRTAEERVLRVQALVDNELPADQIRDTLEMIRSDSSLQDEYAELLKLRRSVGPGPATRVPEAWVEQAERRIHRRTGRGIGVVLLVGSYAILLGYALFTLFASPKTPVIVAILISASVLGFLFLLSNAIMDRMRERRTDKYREVMR